MDFCARFLDISREEISMMSKSICMFSFQALFWSCLRVKNGTERATYFCFVLLQKDSKPEKAELVCHTSAPDLEWNGGEIFIFKFLFLFQGRRGGERCCCHISVPD